MNSHRPHITAPAGEAAATSNAGVVVADAGAFSATGPKPHNEDRVAALADRGVFCVADGMGIGRGGDIAADLAIATLTSAVPWIDPQVKPEIELAEVVAAAGALVATLGRHIPALARAGTTMSALWITETGEMWAVHIGDSRILRVDADGCTQLSTDHNAAADAPQIPSDSIMGRALRTELSRHLGITQDNTADVFRVAAVPGDLMLLTSDGVHHFVDATAMIACVETTPNAAACARILVETALDAGSDDNSSAVALRLGRRPDPNQDTAP